MISKNLISRIRLGSGWRGDTEGFYPDVWFLTGSEDNIRKYIEENSVKSAGSVR